MFSLKTHHIALQNTFPVKKCLKCYEKEVTEYKQKCTFSVTFAHCPFITSIFGVILENSFTQNILQITHTHEIKKKLFSKITF